MCATAAADTVMGGSGVCVWRRRRRFMCEAVVD